MHMGRLLQWDTAVHAQQAALTACGVVFNPRQCTCAARQTAQTSCERAVVRAAAFGVLPKVGSAGSGQGEDSACSIMALRGAGRLPG